jgi:MFS family permease
VKSALGRSLASLHVPNYRRYFVGQVVSLSGNWMQIVAEMWLVVELTGSGVSVGFTAALQFLPMLLFGAWGGLLADRIPKRRLLMVTQALMVLPSLALWGLTAGGGIEIWMVYALVFIRGTVNAIDNPARQSFAIEMVGGDRLVNAVSLNSVIVHVARILGPAGAGIAIALVGVSACFALNALTFLVMIAALRSMDPRALHAPAPAGRGAGQLRSAVRYVLRTPELRIPLAMMALIGTFSFNFQVILPLFAQFTWEGSASAYAGLTAAMAIGSVAGALVAGARGRVSPKLLVVAAAAFGAFELLASVAPTLPLQLAILVPLGAVSVTFAAGINSALQLAVDPAMRGRVMALYSIVFLGSTPIGAPIAGWVAEAVDPRAAMVLGAVAALVAAAGAREAYRRAGSAVSHGPLPRAAQTA